MALVPRQKPVATENLEHGAFESNRWPERSPCRIYGFGRWSLNNVTSYRRGLVTSGYSVFGYGLGDFALVQQLFCAGFTFLALVIAMRETRTNLPWEFAKRLLTIGQRWRERLTANLVTLFRGKKGKST